MKILHVLQSTAVASGGPAEAVKQLKIFFEAHAQFQDVDITVVSLDIPLSPQLHLTNFPYIPLRLHRVDYCFPFSLLQWLRHNIDSFDLVIVDGIWDWHLFVVWLVATPRQKKYLVFAHGHLDPWFKYQFPLKHIKKWLFWPWAFFPALFNAKAVVFTCNKERILARKSFWLYRCTEAVVNFGVQGIPDPSLDYKTTFLKTFNFLVQPHLLLFLGRLHPKKGPDLLFYAISELVRLGLWHSSERRLVIAGPNDGAYVKSLQRLAKSLGITSSIYWTGVLQGDLKWGAFQAAEAFILPSHQENFGIAVVESLSASTPVLITHPVNISPEIALDNAGFVEDDTLNGVLNLLMRWIRLDPASSHSMRANARSCFERRYTISNYASSYLQLCKRTL